MNQNAAFGGNRGRVVRLSRGLVSRGVSRQNGASRNRVVVVPRSSFSASPL